MHERVPEHRRALLETLRKREEELRVKLGRREHQYKHNGKSKTREQMIKAADLLEACRAEIRRVESMPYRSAHVVTSHQDNWRELSMLRAEERTWLRRYLRNGTEKQMQKLSEIRSKVKFVEAGPRNGKTK